MVKIIGATHSGNTVFVGTEMVEFGLDGIAMASEEAIKFLKERGYKIELVEAKEKKKKADKEE